MSNNNRKKAEISTNLYELNKINMKQINPIDEKWLYEKLLEISKTIISSNIKYWMLLCRERYDITIFNINNKPNVTPISFTADVDFLASELDACFLNRGAVLDLTDRADGSYEIWIRDAETQENFVYYLFNYSEGVIEI